MSKLTQISMIIAMMLVIRPVATWLWNKYADLNKHRTLTHGHCNESVKQSDRSVTEKTRRSVAACGFTTNTPFVNGLTSTLHEKIAERCRDEQIYAGCVY
jgi:hypothetical protein